MRKTFDWSVPLTALLHGFFIQLLLTSQRGDGRRLYVSCL